MKKVLPGKAKTLLIGLAMLAGLLLSAGGTTTPTIAKPDPPASAALSANPAPVAAPATADAINTGCKADADCAIKDIGSCCGFNPRCLNKDSPTFPEQVSKRCAKQGRVGVCGIRAIDSCQCVAGKCTGVMISDNSGLLQ